ncbi:MAG: Gfo/Idh/MocA family oxidoreductase [Candidatus Heimdallarchaeota archaeon]|nr:Gfo/Idh/MocA family oxidoreductase [Candidatus Heimdallarchaeota archaeon]
MSIFTIISDDCMTAIGQKPVTAILVGAGSRGKDAYGSYALKYPKRLKFIAVADINEERRKVFQKLHKIADNMVFSSWEDLLNEKIGKIAQVAFICTPDRIHYQPAMKALDLNYDLFLEKPIAPTLQECLDIAKLADEKSRIVQIGHVLRFTVYWQKVKDFIANGKLGKIIHYEQSENVSYWHFGHSFVRGPYNSKETSTAIVLAKTCHDLDLINWIMAEKPIDVYSYGELTYYKPENAPLNSPKRCIDGCPSSENCPWFAPRLYVDLEPIMRIGTYSQSRIIRWITKRIIKSKSFRNFIAYFNKDIRKIKNWNQFPVSHITNDYSVEGRMKALKEGPFGLCIFKAGNDVPDHQISTFNFSNGSTATLTMLGLSEHEGRELRIFGTEGVLRGIFRNNLEEIKFTDLRYGKVKILHKKGLSIDSHGGGDHGIMHAFTSVLLGEKVKTADNLIDVISAMESHFMGFAAEESRVTGKKQFISDYRGIKK